MVVSALLWKWILNDDMGLLKYVLSKFFSIKEVGFLTNPKTAVYTLIFVMTWRVIGYVMVQALAGLRSINEDLEEAAVIDGASRWQLFWRIRLPLIATPVIISSIIVVMSNINNLIVPLSLTGGGPGKSTMVIAIEIYRQSFTYYHFGEASALSIILIAINVVFTVLYLRTVKYEL
jgi:ABC-type sugar transport system permease subunit